MSAGLDRGRSQNDDKRHLVCQNLSLQLDALAQQGVTKELTFTDKLSGAKDDRPRLSRCLTSLQPGDTLVVWRLLDDGPQRRGGQLRVGDGA